MRYKENYCSLLKTGIKFEFHIAKQVREQYQFDDELFSINGNVIFADFKSVRLFVQKINSKRNYELHVRPGEVNAAGLIDEIYHFILNEYENRVNPNVFQKAVNFLIEEVNADSLNNVLSDFIDVFPPIDVYNGKLNTADYLNSSTENKSHIEITLQEIITLYFANFNPANQRIIELFDENYLNEKSLYNFLIKKLDEFFQREKKFGPDNQDIFSFLKTPIIKNPNSHEAQLDFIFERWGVLIKEKFGNRILQSKDLMKEDLRFEFLGGGAPTAVPKFKDKMNDADFLTLGKSGYRYAEDIWKDYEEPKNFTEDIDWMPKVVLIAKNVYVWLDQLSKKYQRTIKTLDQIPDEELDLLANWGFNGLWLIGIWERSSASRKIKHLLGNIDATASAYSLYDYQIASDLGGEDAFNNLNARAFQRGIRLASDMVPNHTGIFSKWILEKPNYFIQIDYSPFPNYTFNGPDLSDDPSIQIRIEDHYWNRSDAAVVFQRIDNRTGEIRYIYHGNDGTNMPWNDTAQLNMIKQEVREAVIQKILEVARKFSIIRFDAAMTLTKRHFSRLWYPPPGQGGDIPSRSDFSMTQSEFDKLFPTEFWREVVDRINSEMPNTLLLAEAFWLMEGYFVRSLGMHRVYNSAFMHMMMKEENEKYRDLITNTLEFEPEILKRYVNFMSNPDEETAIKQFGTDDKYFGVCTLMVTLPGLPMFAHGQIEGFTEKYGMEYKKAYYQESPLQWLIERHEREIFPLIKKRYIFAGVENFWLFDFIDSFGNVNENVFAFTNMAQGERAVVFYNNKFEYTSGKIYRSTSKLVNEQLQTKTLSDAIKINTSKNYFYVYRELNSKLEFIKSGEDIAQNGFSVELHAFKYKVFIDFKEVYDDSGAWQKLCEKLDGRGVSNIQQEKILMTLEPVHKSFGDLFLPETIEGFINYLFETGKNNSANTIVEPLENKYKNLLKEITRYCSIEVDHSQMISNFISVAESAHNLNSVLCNEFPVDKNIVNKNIQDMIVFSIINNYKENIVLLLLWDTIRNLKELFEDKGKINKSNFINKLMLDIPIKNILMGVTHNDTNLYYEISLLNVLFHNKVNLLNLFEINYEEKQIDNITKTTKDNYLSLIDSFFENEHVKFYLGVNCFEGVWYYNKERFEELLKWILTINLLSLYTNDKNKSKEEIAIFYIKKLSKLYSSIVTLSNECGYKYDFLKEKLKNLILDNNLKLI
ncbi:alpha-amylase family glycosyl hydrolase [Melioribacteraceae bacterium 4301-Me]|uniref:alpha-amylase family glycosyl hydrolase n=1 Tax=Pyranulibacter aquaticus TaxID=3163344 RepID=UPI003597627F